MTAPTTVSNEQQISTALSKAGFTNTDIAGVLGNLQVESGFNPLATNSKEGAFGIGQWEGGRLTALKQFATAHGTSVDSLATQIEFLVSESSSRGTTALLQTASTPTQAADIFSTSYEVNDPASNGQRESFANTIFSQLQAGTTLTGGSSNGSLIGNVEAGATPGSGTPASIVGGVTGLEQDAVNLYNDFTSLSFWVRIGFILIGVILLIVGIDKLIGGGLIPSSNKGQDSGFAAPDTTSPEPGPTADIRTSVTPPPVRSSSKPSPYTPRHEGRTGRHEQGGSTIPVAALAAE